MGLSSPMGQGAVLADFRDTSESLYLILKRSEKRQEKSRLLCVFTSKVTHVHFKALCKLLYKINT